MSEFQPRDFVNFEQMIAPTLIKWLYWIGLVVIAIMALMELVTALGSMGQSFLGGLGMLIGVVLGAVFAVLFWRVMCELYIVLFRIYERLGEIARKDT